MKKAKISLMLSGKPVQTKIEFARNVVARTTSNSNFTNPQPVLTAVTTAANDLENAHTAALDGGKSKTALMKAKEKLLDDLLTQLGHYIEATANGDAVKILSSGMNIKSDKVTTHLPDAPNKVEAQHTSNEGQIELHWNKVTNARVYVIEQCDDVSTLQNSATNNSTTSPTWKQVAIVTKTRAFINGLTSGLKYAYRIYCVGAGGSGSYSGVMVAKSL